MSILKRINLIRTVQILLTALVVLCCLHLAVGSGQYKLTSNAYTNTYDDNRSIKLLYSQWDYYSSQSLVYNWYILGKDGVSVSPYAFGCECYYSGGAELSYQISIKDGSGNQVYTSPYHVYKTGDIINVALPPVTATNQDIIYRVTVYVSRLDNVDINRTSMYSGTLTWYCYGSEEVTQSTLPSEWLDTTTQSTGVFIPLTTVTTPVDDYTGVNGGTGSDGVQRDIDYYLQLPAYVLNFAQFVFNVFGRLFALRYVEGFVCYCMVVATVLFVYDKLGGY